MSKYAAKDEVTIVYKDVFQYIRDFASCWDLMRWKIFHSVKSSKIVREDLDQPL